MSKGHPTTLFISSTCYDLSQVRVDLADFARTMGLEPIMSESDSFPINPDEDTVTNCLNIVKTKADIFLLVVGGRYGSINDTGKSITNLEFLEASARGIPKYVFIKKDILTLLPIWKSNPQADFSSAVDTPKLFEFVANLRESGDLWVFPFDTAQDIAQTMRKQLSYLLADCLDIRSKFNEVDIDTLQLGPGTLKIYIDKKPGWEHHAFAKAVEECMAKYRKKRFDYDLGLSFGSVIKFENPHDLRDWIYLKIDRIVHLAKLIERAINVGMKDALGEDGQAGDISRIWHAAERMADVYGEFLDWSLEFDRIKCDDSMHLAIAQARSILDTSIEGLEKFSANLSEDVDGALKLSREVGHKSKVGLTLKFGDTKLLVEELVRLTSS